MPDDDVVAEEAPGTVDDVAVEEDEEFKPRGTMVIMLVFDEVRYCHIGVPNLEIKRK